MKKPTNAYLYFIVSVGLIVAAIAFTAIINRNVGNTESADTRAKAALVGVKFTATVLTLDPFVVDNVQFENTAQKDKSLGRFTVAGQIPPSLTVGAKVKLTVVPQSFKVAESGNTMTATDIAITR